MMNMTLPHPCRVTSAGADQRKLYPAAEIITSTFPESAPGITTASLTVL